MFSNLIGQLKKLEVETHFSKLSHDPKQNGTLQMACNPQRLFSKPGVGSVAEHRT